MRRPGDVCLSNSLLKLDAKTNVAEPAGSALNVRLRMKKKNPDRYSLPSSTIDENHIKDKSFFIVFSCEEGGQCYIFLQIVQRLPVLVLLL